MRRARAFMLVQQHALSRMETEIRRLSHYYRYFERPAKKVFDSGTEFMEIFFVKGGEYIPLFVEVSEIKLLIMARHDGPPTCTPWEPTKIAKFAQSLFPSIPMGTYGMALAFGKNVLNMNYASGGEYNITFQHDNGIEINMIGDDEALDFVKNMYEVHPFPMKVHFQ